MKRSDEWTREDDARAKKKMRAMEEIQREWASLGPVPMLIDHRIKEAKKSEDHEDGEKSLDEAIDDVLLEMLKDLMDDRNQMNRLINRVNRL